MESFTPTDEQLLAARAARVLDRGRRGSGIDSVEEVLVDISARVLALEAERRRTARELEALRSGGAAEPDAAAELVRHHRSLGEALKRLHALRLPLQQRRTAHQLAISGRPRPPGPPRRDP